MLPPLRFGVISAGRMAGFTMLDLMSDHPAATAAAWYELDPSRPDTAARIPKLIERGIERCSTLDALLARDDLDVILNATSHNAHAETTIAALRAGRHVLCEKPPACSLGEIEAMIDAAAQADRRCLIHFQHLLRPSARRLNEAICGGELGAIRRVSCLSLWRRTDEYYQRVDWAGRRQWGGRPTLDGVMVNQSVHFLNQMLAFADRRGPQRVAAPAEVRAALYRFHPAEVLEMEDNAVVVGRLNTPDATEFAFAATTCADGSEGATRADEYAGRVRPHRVVVEGERGRATWDGATRIEIDGEPARVFDEPEGPWPFYFHLQNVLAGAENPVTAVAESINTMRVIFAAYESTGDRIIQRDGPDGDPLADTLATCAETGRLPAELDAPPPWA